MALRRPAIIACAALAVGGCGSAQDQIRSTVQRLADAARAHDYQTICQDVLAPSLVRRLTGNGISCRQAMRVALGGVRDPVISIGKITVHGRRGTAITLTVARGQQAALSAIELLQTGDGWRISSLGSPLHAGAR
jgi:hypothetical protein